MTPTLTADHLSDLLAQRHKDDVWVPECKDGPTQMGPGMLQLDGWAMKRSWSRPCMYGYEIKVSRSDYMRDSKWHMYLRLCNRFYFVCPRKLIQPDELPAQVGLLWATANGSRLLQKKPAPYQEIEPPADLLRYILMCRAQNDGATVGESSADYWRKWLQTKAEHHDLGRAVSVEMARRVEALRRQAKQAARELEQCAEVRDWLERHEIPMDTYSHPIRWLLRIEPLLDASRRLDFSDVAEKARTLAEAAEALSRLGQKTTNNGGNE